MAEFNENGGLEISVGPRGYSVVDTEVSEDGTMFRHVTNQPGYTNWMPLNRGPRGFKGDYGDPGESRLRVDEASGYRVFQWDVATTGENMIYGDTGVWDLDGTTWVRRVNNSVETNATDPTTLPEGFRPTSAGFTEKYLTSDIWPETIAGTQIVPPLKNRGLESFAAAVAQGYPGSAEEFMDMAYRVVLPPAGATGQVLTRTDAGSSWMDLPLIGPSAWTNITLTANWAPLAGEVPSVRYNNGTIEMIGEAKWTGALTKVGVWGNTFSHIGNIPPGFAPTGHMDTSVRVHRGDPGSGEMNFPINARVDINSQGQIFLGAYGPNDNKDYTAAEVDQMGFYLESGEASVNMANISYPLRNSSPLA